MNTVEFLFQGEHAKHSFRLLNIYTLVPLITIRLGAIAITKSILLARIRGSLGKWLASSGDMLSIVY